MITQHHCRIAGHRHKRSPLGAGVDPATPVNEPFSADFRWATLPGIQATPIQFTDGQAKVFEALWALKGAEMDDERIM
ncbi:MAG: hypothetical protein ABS45_03130 [Comamonas sp. SCN 65-56]|uniref:hypothetical protein n=1 Tax=Comamonas sp. SCN 65-56 TaxID=1660095 RepID=UPI00086BB373|nr:hypothetical protein [Comamonas sp. SCN 65-56]ODS93207.1 MAG: hypothetical protein ABS45_03130 [Comamonas sp. SCN 65-56]